LNNIAQKLNYSRNKEFEMYKKHESIFFKKEAQKYKRLKND